MAFTKTAQHSGHFGKGTLAETQALLAALTAPQRAEYIGSVATITDQGNKKLWIVTEDSIIPITDEFANYINSTEATQTVTHSVDNAGQLTSVVNFNPAGALATSASGVKLNYADTFSIDLDVNGNNELTAGVKYSAGGGMGELTDGIAVLRIDSDTTSWGLGGGSGDQLQVNVSFSGAADNAAKNQSGVYVKKMTVAQASQGLLSIDPVTNEISFAKQAQMDVFVDSTSADLAEFITNTLPDLTDVSVGDYVYIKNAADKTQRGFIIASATPTTANDYVPVEFPDYTVSQIRAMFDAELGVQFNPTSGMFSAKLDTVAARNDMDVSADGLLVDVYASSKSILGGIGDATVEGNLEELYSRTNTLNAVQYSNMITKTGSDVKAGGDATENTTFSQLGFDVTYTSTGGKFIFDHNEVYFKDSFVIANELNELVRMSLGVNNFWKSTPLF